MTGHKMSDRTALGLLLIVGVAVAAMQLAGWGDGIIPTWQSVITWSVAGIVIVALAWRSGALGFRRKASALTALSPVGMIRSPL